MAKAIKQYSLEEKQKRVFEEKERQQMARKERENKLFNDAIELKKREIIEKLEMRNSVIQQREATMQSVAERAEQIRNLKQNIRIKMAEQRQRKMEMGLHDEGKEKLLDLIQKQI